MTMPRLLIASVLLLSMARVATAGEATADSAAAQPITLPSPGLEGLTQDFMLRDGLSTTGSGYLNLSLSMSAMSWYRPPTRFDAVLHGAGTAATLGLFLGAVGNTLGWFDEDTSWWLTGSMATVGALYAGSKYEPEPTLRIRWTPGNGERR